MILYDTNISTLSFLLQAASPRTNGRENEMKSRSANQKMKDAIVLAVCDFHDLDEERHPASLVDRQISLEAAPPLTALRSMIEEELSRIHKQLGRHDEIRG